MTYNLAGLRKRVLVDKLDDDEFDPEVVDNFINDTIRDIYNQFELPFQEKIFNGTIPAGSTIFRLPNDVALIQAQYVHGVEGFHRERMAWRDFIQKYKDPMNATPAEPSVWTMYANSIMLAAPTDKDYTMTIFYIKKPKTLLENTDVPELPEEFSEIIVLGTYRRILERNEDFDLAIQVEGRYAKMLTDLVNRYGFRAADGPIVMKNKQIHIGR